MKKEDNGLNGFSCKTYVAAGAMNIENIEHVEHLFPGNHDILSEFFGKGSSSHTDDEVSDIDIALAAVASMAEDGRFNSQKNYYGAYKIIEERLAKGMSTADFCKMMKSRTTLREVLLPKNDNIRKIVIKKDSKYPNWHFEGENITWIMEVTDIAKEVLNRINSKK